MYPYILLLVVLSLFGSSGFGAQAEPVPARVPETTTPAEAPAPASAPASAEKSPGAVDAAIAQMVDAVARETKPSKPESAVAAVPVAPPVSVAVEAPAATIGMAPAVVPPVSTTDAHFETLSKSVSLMQQLMFAQQDREVRDFNNMQQLMLAQHEREVRNFNAMVRLVTIFGGTFAGLCMIGLLAAAFLNHRALVAVQRAYPQVQHGNGTTSANGLLPASTAAVPGIERVQASGQRFQTRMTGLEQRLAELEHLTGREAHTNGDTPVARAEAGPSPTAPTAEEAGLVAPPALVVPRAMILVHKAQALANLGKLTDALATLDEASAFDGTKTEVNLARGQVLEKLGRLGDALKAYDTAVGADDHNTSALLLKAGVLNRQERFSEALACYERALEVHRAAV